MSFLLKVGLAGRLGWQKLWAQGGLIVSILISFYILRTHDEHAGARVARLDL